MRQDPVTWARRKFGHPDDKPALRSRDHLQSPDAPEHELVLTGAGKNSNMLRVRCKCMAEYKNVSSRYYNYDYIADVDTIAEATEAFRYHVVTGATKTPTPYKGGKPGAEQRVQDTRNSTGSHN